MSSLSPKKTVVNQIRHRETPRVPYTISYEEEVAVRIDAYYGSDSWRNGFIPYMVGVSAVDTDYKEEIGNGRVRDAYGGIWRTDRRPWHLEQPPLGAPTFAGYDFPKPEAFFRPENKKRGYQTCEEHPDSFVVGHLGWGLFERSWNLRGFENALADAVLEPAFYEEMLDRLTELYLAFVEYTVDLPVDGILFGDDWGDQRGVILGPERWRELIKPRWRRIYDAVHAAGKVVMSHSCGSVRAILPDIIEIGMDVLESVQPEAAGMDPSELKAAYGDRITFWGCLGSQSTIGQGTPAEVKTAVERLVREMPKGGGYILAPAKPLQPGTPVENAVALVEALQKL
jgi:uroporphyrinogen decarboxylase